MSRHKSDSGSSLSRDKYREDHHRYDSRRDDDKDRDRDRDRERRRRHRDSPPERRQRFRSRENVSKRDGSENKDSQVKEMSISPKRDESDSDDAIDEGLPEPPPAPRITKISIGFNKSAPKPQPIKMKLNPAPLPPAPVPALKPKVASVFGDASDEEPEEMPAEARMRMRNIGRDTPTSAGPNSFGKTKHGFCDAKNIFQRNLKEAMEKVNPSQNTAPKFPTTVYKYQP